MITTNDRRWLGCVVALCAGGLALYSLRAILLPFGVGVLLAYLLDPLCDRLETWGLRRGWATLLLVLIFLVGSGAIAIVLLPPLVEQSGMLLALLPEGFAAIQRSGLEVLEQWRASSPETQAQITKIITASASTLVSWVQALALKLLGSGFAVLNLLSLLLITPMVSFYLLRDWDRLFARITEMIAPEQRPLFRRIAQDIDQVLAGFLRGQGIVSLLLATFYALALMAAGVQFALVLGIVSGLLAIVPVIGGLLAAALAIGCAVMQFQALLPVCLVIVIYAVGQILEGSFLSPRLVGVRVRLHPLWMVLALLIGGKLLGFLGVLISVPVAGSLAVCLRHLLAQRMKTRADDDHADDDHADDDHPLPAAQSRGGTL